LNPQVVPWFPPEHAAAAAFAEEARSGAMVLYVKGARTVVEASQAEK
jgi:hypothetical protein